MISQKSSRMRIVTKNVWMVSVAVLFFSQCTGDAPRENPLDPESPLYDARGQISGRCHRVYDDSRGIPEVQVILEAVDRRPSAEKRVMSTDENGAFRFSAVMPDSYRIVFQKEGYASDTLYFALQPKETVVRNIPLDARPVVTAARITTGHTLAIDSVTHRYFLQFEIHTNDPDRDLDIEQVECQIPGLDITLSLLPNQDHTIWTHTVELDTLTVSRPEAFIGEPLVFVVTTNTNFKIRRFVFSPYFLTRFVHVIPILLSPKNNEVTGPRPTFRWKKPETGFQPLYDFELSRVIGPGEFETTRIINLQADSSYTHPIRLVIGNYFWRLVLKDQFGNWARSRAETFEVR